MGSVVGRGVEAHDAARDEEQRQRPDAARVVCDPGEARALAAGRPLPQLEPLGPGAQGRHEHQRRAGHGPLELPERPAEPRRRRLMFQIDAPTKTYDGIGGGKFAD